MVSCSSFAALTLASFSSRLFTWLVSASVLEDNSVWVAVLSWAIGGFGMGLAYSPLSITVLAAAKPGEEGVDSAALQLSDALGIAIGIGIGGSVIALSDAHRWAVSSGTAVVFAISVVVGVIGLLATRRLPREVPGSH